MCILSIRFIKIKIMLFCVIYSLNLYCFFLQGQHLIIKINISHRTCKCRLLFNWVNVQLIGCSVKKLTFLSGPLKKYWSSPSANSIPTWVLLPFLTDFKLINHDPLVQERMISLFQSAQEERLSSTLLKKMCRTLSIIDSLIGILIVELV